MTEPDTYDAYYYWDPVCPFSWITSRWVEKVVTQRGYQVDWRFISLRLVNKDVDYASTFPSDYEDGHTAGLRLLRMAAKVRAENGRSVMGPLYTALGESIFDIDQAEFNKSAFGTAAHVAPILELLGLSADYADALDDDTFDAEIQAETDEARTKTGEDVGTPIIHYKPPAGPALFGPVISRVPADEDAAVLWDHVVGLASFPSFTELKRSLREMPALKALGADEPTAGRIQDWHGGTTRRPDLE